MSNEGYSHENSKGVTYFLRKMQVTMRARGPKTTLYFFTKIPDMDRGEACVQWRSFLLPYH